MRQIGRLSLADDQDTRTVERINAAVALRIPSTRTRNIAPMPIGYYEATEEVLDNHRVAGRPCLSDSSRKVVA